MAVRNILRNRSVAPRDLRTHDSGAGNLYPVDPNAIAHYKRVMAQKKQAQQQRAEAIAARQKALDIARRGRKKRPEPQKEQFMEKQECIPVDLYPPEAIEAAKVESEKAARSRRYTSIFTKDVIAVWRKYLAEGKSTFWLAGHNGLIEVSEQTVLNYLSKFPKKQIRPSAVETAVAKPEPEEAETVTKETAVAILSPEDEVALLPEDAPAVSHQLLALAQMIAANKNVNVKGKVNVSLELSYEFG